MAFEVISEKLRRKYYLHERNQELKGGCKLTIYYFGAEAREGAIDALPPGYVVSEHAKTGFPLVRKKR